MVLKKMNLKNHLWFGLMKKGKLIELEIKIYCECTENVSNKEESRFQLLSFVSRLVLFKRPNSKNFSRDLCH